MLNRRNRDRGKLGQTLEEREGEEGRVRVRGVRGGWSRDLPLGWVPLRSVCVPSSVATDSHTCVLVCRMESARERSPSVPLSYILRQLYAMQKTMFTNTRVGRCADRSEKEGAQIWRNGTIPFPHQPLHCDATRHPPVSIGYSSVVSTGKAHKTTDCTGQSLIGSSRWDINTK